MIQRVLHKVNMCCTEDGRGGSLLARESQGAAVGILGREESGDFFCKQANNGNKKNKENPTNLNDPDVGRMLLCNNHMDHKGVGDDGCRRL